MKKLLYILIMVGSFFIGWASSYICHEGLYGTRILKIGLFQKELEQDRWIIEQYHKERRRKYEDSTENKMIDSLGKIQVHIKYREKVNGYDVSAVCFIDKEHNGMGYSRYNPNAIWGNAWLYFKNDKHELIVGNPSFTDEILFNNDRPLMNQMSVKVDYTPFEMTDDNTFSGNESPFFFFDIDFDGEEELIICQWEQMGYQGHHTYKAYKINVEKGSHLLLSMREEPFDELNDYTIFDTLNKTISTPIEVGLKMGGYKRYGQKLLYELKEVEEYDWEHTRGIKYESCEPTVYHYKMINGNKHLVKVQRCPNDTTGSHLKAEIQRMQSVSDDAEMFIFNIDEDKAKLQKIDKHTYWLMNRMMQMQHEVSTPKEEWAWMQVMKSYIHNSDCFEMDIDSISRFMLHNYTSNQQEMNGTEFVEATISRLKTLYKYESLINSLNNKQLEDLLFKEYCAWYYIYKNMEDIMRYYTYAPAKYSSASCSFTSDTKEWFINRINEIDIEKDILIYGKQFKSDSPIIKTEDFAALIEFYKHRTKAKIIEETEDWRLQDKEWLNEMCADFDIPKLVEAASKFDIHLKKWLSIRENIKMLISENQKQAYQEMTKQIYHRLFCELTDLKDLNY